MSYLKNFTAFLNEDESSEEKLAKLARLRDLGLLEPDQYKADSNSIRKDAMLAAIDRGEYAGTAIPEIREVINSPEAQLLKDRGLEIVSSPTRLLNGTLVWAKPGYTTAKGWGLGFYPGTGIIRRMTPKGINLGVWFRNLGSMDIIIKKIPKTVYSTDSEFYRVAMKWAADHIDWDQLEKAHQTGDPEVWRYYTKGKTKQGYFNNENN